LDLLQVIFVYLFKFFVFFTASCQPSERPIH
jgi:hypothetical protein